MELIGIKKNEKNESCHTCEICDFKCSYTSDWNRHISTRKHRVNVNGNKMELTGIKKNEKNEYSDFTCKNCNQKYKTQSGLWKHNKKCFITESEINYAYKLLNPELIMDLIKDNKEMKKIR